MMPSIIRLRAATLALVGAALVAQAGNEAIRVQENPVFALFDDFGDDPRYVIEADAYRAELFPDGRIRLARGDTELIRDLVLAVRDRHHPLGHINRVEPLTFEVRERMEDDTADLPPGFDRPVETPDTPGMRLVFDEGGVTITFLALQDENEHVYGVLGDAAVGVRNLRLGRDDSLPTRRLPIPHRFATYNHLGHYWPDLEFAYTDGTRVSIRDVTGVAHSIRERDAQRAIPALRSRRGYWMLRDAKAGQTVRLDIGDGQPLRPVPHIREFRHQVEHATRWRQPYGLFDHDEPVILDLSLHADYLEAGDWQVDWRLEDHRQNPAGTGSYRFTLSADGPHQIPVDLTPDAMGYFRAYLAIRAADGAPSATRTLEFSFGRLRLERPALRAHAAGSVARETLWANVLGSRGIRINMSLAQLQQHAGDGDGGIDWEAARDWMDATHFALCREGTVRGINILIEPNAHQDEALNARYPEPEERDAVLTDWLREWGRVAGELGVEGWDPVNEPDLRMSPAAYLETFLKRYHAGIAAGGGRLLGTSACGLNKYRWLRQLYEAGGKPYMDDITFHPYTPVGFQEAYRAELDEWWHVMAEFGHDDARLWMNESAWHRGWGYSQYIYERFEAVRETSARHIVNMLLNAEARGIPRERVHVFYYQEHGYNDFYLLRRHEPTPAAISLQVMNENLRDAAFVREIALPGSGRYVQLYRDASRTVAVAFTSDEPVPLRMRTDAPVVVVTDMLGNRRQVAPDGGELELTIDGDPRYLMVGPEHTLEPVLVALPVQPNLALAVRGADGTDAGLLMGDPAAYTVARWQAEQPLDETHPAETFEIRLAEPVPVSRVRVHHDYGAWDRTLRDYEVQVAVDDGWRTVGELKGNFYRNVVEHDFEPVVTGHVRLRITAVNTSLFKPGSVDWIKPVPRLRGIEVHGAPGAPAQAFFVHRAARRARIQPGDSYAWTLTLRNLSDAPVEGTLRLHVGEGLQAAAREQVVSLPAGRTVAFEVELEVAADTEAGRIPVAVGLYDGDRLISADYAARVIEVVE